MGSSPHRHISQAGRKQEAERSRDRSSERTKGMGRALCSGAITESCAGMWHRGRCNRRGRRPCTGVGSISEKLSALSSSAQHGPFGICGVPWICLPHKTRHVLHVQYHIKDSARLGIESTVESLADSGFDSIDSQDRLNPRTDHY